MGAKKLNKESQIRSVIRDCLLTDEDLIMNRHHSPVKGIDGCVDFTFRSLFLTEDLEGITHFYALREGGKNYGFVSFNNEYKLVNSFHIKKEYRNNGYCDPFWIDLESIVENDIYYICFWNDNERAKRFVENKGGKVSFLSEDKEGIIYKLKKCQ